MRGDEGFHRMQGVCGLWLIVLLTACAAPAPPPGTPPAVAQLSLPSSTTLAVIGVKRSTGSLDPTQAHYERVGFGLTHLLAEALAATGHFRLLEERALQRQQLLETWVQTYWLGERESYTVSQLCEAALQLGVQSLAYGTVSYQSSQREIRIPPGITMLRQVVRVTVESCLYTTTVQARLCALGTGEATQKIGALIYEWRGNRIDFAQGALGMATAAATQDAVAQLSTRIYFAP